MWVPGPLIGDVEPSLGKEVIPVIRLKSPTGEDE